MINITTTKIPHYNPKKHIAERQGKSNFEQKTDSFEISAKPISFTGIESKVNLRFPAKAAEELFAKAFDGIKNTKIHDEKIDLTYDCMEQFKELLESSGPKANEKLSEVQAQFLDDRAHEIMNPFSELSYYMMTSGAETGHHKPSCDKFDQFCTYSFSRIIKGVKRYESFLDKGLEGDILSPKDVFKMAADSASEKSKIKNIKIKSKGDGILEACKNGIYGANGRVHDYELYTIFSNLIQNSAKYSPENSTIITKFEKKTVGNEKRLVFSVIDQGIGIPKKEQEKVLNGQRASNAIDSGIQGTGYGLMRVNKMLKFMDSHLEIESPINKANKEFPGSKISCSFKLKEENTSFFNRDFFHGLFT
jgi:light-regulated signal transduction histidine kinase (bacteriophytochrome)